MSSLSKLLDRAKYYTHKVVKEQYDGSGCYTCGSHVSLDPGHCYSAGKHPEVRFDLRNIRMQCRYRCNGPEFGRVEKFKILLAEENQEDFEQLEMIVDHARKNGFKWEQPEVRKKIEEMKRLLKE